MEQPPRACSLGSHVVPPLAICLLPWDGFLATCSSSPWYPGPQSTSPFPPSPSNRAAFSPWRGRAQAQGRVEVSCSLTLRHLGLEHGSGHPCLRCVCQRPQPSQQGKPVALSELGTKRHHLEFLVLSQQEGLPFYYALSPSNYVGIPDIDSLWSSQTPSPPPNPHVPASSFCGLLPIAVVICSSPFYRQTTEGSSSPPPTSPHLSPSLLPRQFLKAASSPLPPCTPTPQPSLCRTCLHFCHETAFTDTSRQVQARFSASLSAARAPPTLGLDLCTSRRLSCSWLLAPARALALGLLLCPL